MEKVSIIGLALAKRSFQALAVAPTQIAQRIRPLRIVANDQLFDPALTERSHLGDFADAVPLGEKPNRLKMPRRQTGDARMTADLETVRPSDATVGFYSTAQQV